MYKACSTCITIFDDSCFQEAGFLSSVQQCLIYTVHVSVSAVLDTHERPTPAHAEGSVDRHGTDPGD